MVFTATGAAFVLRPDSATQGNAREPNASVQEAPAETVHVPRPTSPVKLEASDSVRNESRVKQEVTVNGRNVPVPENGETRRIISENGNQLDVTIDSHQRSTSSNSSSSTHISTDVRVTQEGGE